LGKVNKETHIVDVKLYLTTALENSQGFCLSGVEFRMSSGISLLLQWSAIKPFCLFNFVQYNFFLDNSYAHLDKYIKYGTLKKLNNLTQKILISKCRSFEMIWKELNNSGLLLDTREGTQGLSLSLIYKMGYQYGYPSHFSVNLPWFSGKVVFALHSTVMDI
jgi:hypothetical protein